MRIHCPHCHQPFETPEPPNHAQSLAGAATVCLLAAFLVTSISGDQITIEHWLILPPLALCLLAWLSPWK